jgi:hypothetical protein
MYNDDVSREIASGGNSYFAFDINSLGGELDIEYQREGLYVDGTAANTLIQNLLLNLDTFGLVRMACVKDTDTDGWKVVYTA